MNKLLTIACCLATLAFSSCMESSVVDVDIAGSKEAVITRYDGTIYEYLKAGDPNLGVTFDSLVYFLDLPDEERDASGIPLKLNDLRRDLKDETGQYTLMALPDSCFRVALKALNKYRKLNKLQLSTEDLDEDAGEKEKYAIGELTLKKLWNYQKVVETISRDKDENLIYEHYEYKSQLDSLLCRYMAPGIYDTPQLSTISSVEGQMIQGLHTYRMSLFYRRLPASGYQNAGLKELTLYDMGNTLDKDKWEPAKVQWTDIYAKNGVIHVMVPQHEFGFGKFIHYFRNLGHEK
jgi:hypothetical protein